MPHIDGLRAIAVLSVLFFHLDITIFRGGFVGVDIFFVISGFLITKIISHDIQNNKFSFANFYARRIKRIFPALFTMMFFSSLAAILFLGLSQYSEFFKALRMASGQISNIFFSKSVAYFDVGHDNSPLLHTWSLGVEEQFYLVWPILLLALHRFVGLQKSWLCFIALFAVSLGISEYLLRHDAMASFYLLHARAWELAIGGMVALYGARLNLQPHQNQILSWAGLIAILLSVFFYNDSSFPGIKALAPTLGAGFILLGLMNTSSSTSQVNKILSAPFLRFFGLISYSLYLWHWPLISFYKGYFNPEPSIAAQIWITIISVLIATLSFKYIEQPFRHIKTAPRKVIIIGIITIAAFIGISNVAKHANDASWRVLYNYGENVRGRHKLDKLCSTKNNTNDQKNCTLGPNKDRPEVILAGDSHASHYTYAVLGWAKKHNLTVRLFTRGACVTWLQTDKPHMRDGKHDIDCDELVTGFYKTLGDQPSIQYVFLGMYRPKLDEDMKSSLDNLKSYNKKIIFLGQPPFFPKDPHECQVKNNLLISKIFPSSEHGKDCLKIDFKWSNSVLEPEKQPLIAYLKTIQIKYFDPNPYMLTAFDKDQKHFLYKDESHLNLYGSEHFIEPLSAFMDKKK